MSILIPLSFFLALINAQNPGDPNLLATYPPCAAQCQIEVITGRYNPCAFTNTNNLTCQCAPDNRAATAACQKVSCSPAEYTTTQSLAQQLCGPLYANGPLDEAPVSAAIANLTAVASAAVSGKDPTNSEDYPPCATACQLQNLPSQGCTSLADVACVCKSAALNAAFGGCEQSTCNAQDLQTVRYLSWQLCRPVGGLRNASISANQIIATQTAGSVPMAPTGNATGNVTPFIGAAVSDGVEAGSWVLLSAVFGAMYILM